MACSLHASEDQARVAEEARRLIDQEKSEYMNVEDYLRGLGYFWLKLLRKKNYVTIELCRYKGCSVSVLRGTQYELDDHTAQPKFNVC